MKIEGKLPDGRLVMRTHGGTVVETTDEMQSRLATERADRIAASAPELLAELERLYQKYGLLTTADVIAKATGVRPKLET